MTTDPAPWVQTASGRALTLGAPVPPGLLDIRRDIAIPLANTGRFANQLPDGALYSVAQHCSIGADCLYAQTFDPAAALAFLLHDAHEAILGDITTPVMMALQGAADEWATRILVPHPDLGGMKRRLTDPIDEALHAAAGLPWPLPPSLRDLVHLTDRRLLMAERNHLLAPPPRKWGALERLEPLALKHRIKPMPPAKAAEQWLQRHDQWRAALAEKPRAAAS